MCNNRNADAVVSTYYLSNPDDQMQIQSAFENQRNASPENESPIKKMLRRQLQKEGLE